MVYGRNISDNKEKMLRDLLKSCRQQLNPKQKLRKIEDLKADEIEVIKNRYNGEYLPEGWYFDGRQYMNFDGDIVYDHPNIKMLLEAYLDEQNEKIGDYNRRVDKEWKEDLTKFE